MPSSSPWSVALLARVIAPEIAATRAPQDVMKALQGLPWSEIVAWAATLGTMLVAAVAARLAWAGMRMAPKPSARG